MPQIGTLFLVQLFSALLPPINPEDRDYYNVLDVPRDATNEKIRKAYKLKSLKLHPDKIAQNGNKNKEEAAAEYEKVQEAYGVLVNDEKRQRYNGLGYSPTRYQFVARGNLGNPASMYENLTSATFVDKTRLVVLAMVCLMIVLIQPILIATKLNHLLEQRGALEDSKWTYILIPFWILDGLACLFWCSIVLLVPPVARISVFISALEQIAWYIGIFFLALRWDGTWSTDYSLLLIPIYIAMTLRWTQMAAVLKKIKSDVHRMITPEYLETEILKGKPLEELTEEERQQIISDFLVVTIPTDFIPDNEQGDLDDEGLETQKIEASPEYQAATEIYDSTFGSLVSSFIFGVSFLVVLTLKLDDQIDANWWTVFTPIWVYYGSRLIYNFYSCMCGGLGGEEIVLQMHEHQQQKEKEVEKKNGEKTEDDEKKTNVKENVKKDDSSEVQKDDPRKDSDFVDPEGSIAKDNTPDDEVVHVSDTEKEKEEPAKKEVKEADTESNMPSDEKQSEEKKEGSDKGENEEPAKKEVKEADTESNMPSDEKQSEEKKEGSDKGENDDDDDSHVHIDEDTFRAFQSAYAEAEQDAMQEQAKASTNCCSVCFQLLLICLIVAKLEKSYQNDDPDDVGFNTFWIMFPFFLLFGLICCTCACLVYGAGPGDMSDLVSEQGDGEVDEENPAPKTEDVPIAMPPPPPVTEDASASEATPIAPVEIPSVAPSDATDIEDLD
jgi:hypothetical protein